MLKFLALLLAGFAFTAEVSAQEQVLIFDRAPSAKSVQSLRTSVPNAFLADDFVVGAAKEDWVIDRIRLWAAGDPDPSLPRNFGDLFRKISLLGGIAPEPPTPHQSQSPDCDCHNLPVLKSTSIGIGSNSAENRDVEIAAGPQANGSPSWQVDFRDLKWSVPGGVRIQFGVFAEPASRSTWNNLAVLSDRGDHLRVFSSAGKLEETLDATPARISVQVWGHLLARISIRPDGQKLKVILWSSPFLDVGQVDRSSLRFGPGKAGPESIELDDAQPNQPAALILLFPSAATAIVPGSVNACLIGKRQDGTPFEACDLLPR